MEVRWGAPKQVPILVLDTGGHEVVDLFGPLFSNAAYTCLQPGKLVAHMTPSIVLDTMGYSLKAKSLTVGYIIALIREMRPRIVLTFVDNSVLFQRVARFCRDSGIRFLAIQNGVRMLSRDNPEGTPQIYHSEFACMGHYDVEQYRRHGAQMEFVYPVGSLRDSYYRDRQPAPPVKKRFDLCLISQVKPQHYSVYPDTMRSLVLLAQHVRRFCKEHGTTLCVAARRHPEVNARLFEWEKAWFQEHLGMSVEVVPNVRTEYTSYALVDQSRVSLALHTTLLHEGFGRGNRVLSCNFTGNPQYDFPVDGPWKLSTADYEVFEQRLLQLLNMSAEDYARQVGAWPKYLVAYHPERPTHRFLQQLIAEAIEGLPPRAQEWAL